MIGLILLVLFVASFGLFFIREIENKKPLALVPLVLLILLVGSQSLITVPAGYRGVLLQYGAVKGQMDEGIHVVLPIVQQVQLMEVRTQKLEIADATGASKDLQKVNVKLAVNYHVLPSEVGSLYKNVGTEYREVVIHPAVQEVLKSVTAKYTAEELINIRQKVKDGVDDSLSARLKAYSIIVEPNGVSLTDFKFSDEFDQAIEAKQVAQQEAEKQKYVLLSTKKKAETAIAQAKGEAEANRIKANALNSKGGQKVLAREWIEKWDGKLPVVSGGASSNNLIDISKLIATDAGSEKTE